MSSRVGETIALFAIRVACAVSVTACACATAHAGAYGGLENVTLEMSLKPFKSLDDAFVAAVCEEMFRQWWPLTRHAEQVSVLLWTADGSEILEYKGNLDDRVEWARYIGGANKPLAEPGSPPDGVSLHSQCRLYTEAPPVVTYRALARIVATLKRVGQEINGKPLRVGATFDPGPEFARSPFKYEKHPEICLGNTMGKGTFVCCYSTLHHDQTAYAGFPDGIAEGTPFAVFFGRQCRHFLDDLGFDYIWLSNGFGFGVETWGVTGAVFNGERFDNARIAEARDKTLGFWRDFRKECPSHPVETRGTNLSTGIDLASDGVPLRSIYHGGFNMAPPPNSPWAALDGDFGLELVGYMSHMAELPGEAFPFRYYVHDPWWLNSPWLDRYGREPHDIYLPLSVARINSAGEVKRPSSILFLTVDNSFGEMPVEVPNEVIPHVLRARADSPDQPGPVVWVYPFDEYHDMTFGEPGRVEEVFFGDWFMRQAVNTGFPINTVVSTGNLRASLEARPALYAESVLVAIAPDAGSRIEEALARFIRQGGRVLLYGPLRAAGPEVLGLLNLDLAEPVSGELDIEVHVDADRLASGTRPSKVIHRPLTCAGGLEAILKDSEESHTHVMATVSSAAGRRVAALVRQCPEWHGGAVAWVRGTNSSRYRKGGRLLVPDERGEWFTGPLLMRFALEAFGYTVGVIREMPNRPYPVLGVARCANGFFLSGYSRDTTSSLRLRFPQGAPLLIGFETELCGGCTTYRMPRAWHRECRVFVSQSEDGLLSCTEQPSVEYGVKRRLQVTGLNDATLRFYPDRSGATGDVKMLVDSHYPYTTGRREYQAGDRALGRHLVIEHVSGRLTIAW